MEDTTVSHVVSSACTWSMCREHRDLRGRGAADSHFPPMTGVLLCERRGSGNVIMTVLVTGHISSINRDSHFILHQDKILPSWKMMKNKEKCERNLRRKRWIC
jgi:hypothetical protein